MTEKLNIVQSTTEPDKRNIWLKDNELKKFGAKGWSTIGGSNAGGGGGTSTDKDTLTIVFDYNTKTVTVNNKQFLISSSSEGITEINNKELYNILYNYVVNTNMPVFIKAIDNSFQVSGYATCLFDGENIVQLLLYVIDGTCIIVVYNK